MTSFYITEKAIPVETSMESLGINSMTAGSGRWKINYVSFS